MQDMDSVYRENAEIVYRYLFSLSRDADLAEELTQETFYEAVRSIGKYRGESALSTWLCGIAKNLLKKEVTRRSRHKTHPLEQAEGLSAPTDPEGETLGTLARDEMFRRIHALPEQMREVVYLRLSGDLSFSQIGNILGQSETWARVTFYRAKQALRKGEDE